MKKYIKQILQVLFLFLFIVLVFTGKIQVWILVLLSSLFAAIVFGRLYCGWICPINTVIEWIGRLYKYFGIKQRTVPSWMKKPFIRYSMLLIFLSVFIVVLTTGKKLPVPVLFITGILLSLFFVPQLWHRYLCPFGTLLSFTGVLARNCYKVNMEGCVKCGICKNVCPADAIEMESKEVFPKIRPGLCLVCSNCTEACPKKTIFYK